MDYAINGLISIPYVEAEKRGLQKSAEVPVYNLTCVEKHKQTWSQVMEDGKEVAYRYPFEAGVWYPNGTITTNRMNHIFKVFFFQWLPAYLIDFLMLVCGQKRL